MWSVSAIGRGCVSLVSLEVIWVNQSHIFPEISFVMYIFMCIATNIRIGLNLVGDNMKRLTLWSNTAVVFACALAIAPGLQAQNQDPVGLTPTPDDVDEISVRRQLAWPVRTGRNTVIGISQHAHRAKTLPEGIMDS
jgi:hypothetical protein